MLKGINPLLNAEVLGALRAMGHGDDLIIADTNFPSDSIARQTSLGRLLRIDNTTAAEAAAAVLSVYPLDAFVDDAAARMEFGNNPDEIPPVQSEVQADGERCGGQVLAAHSHRAICVLRAGKEGLLRYPDGRAALLWMLRLPQGRRSSRR